MSYNKEIGEVFYDEMRDVIKEVVQERMRQLKKWGVQDRSMEMWMCILMEEVGEANREVVDYVCENRPKWDKEEDSLIDFNEVQKSRLGNFRKEMVQVAAVAVQVIEWFDRVHGGDIREGIDGLYRYKAEVSFLYFYCEGGYLEELNVESCGLSFGGFEDVLKVYVEKMWRGYLERKGLELVDGQRYVMKLDLITNELDNGYREIDYGVEIMEVCFFDTFNKDSEVVKEFRSNKDVECLINEIESINKDIEWEGLENVGTYSLSFCWSVDGVIDLSFDFDKLDVVDLDCKDLAAGWVKANVLDYLLSEGLVDDFVIDKVWVVDVDVYRDDNDEISFYFSQIYSK